MKLRLQPARDLSGDAVRGWTVTGDDPQFLLRWRFPRTLQPGVYDLQAINAAELQTLGRASVYVDTGTGFNETERALVAFVQRGGVWSARLRFEHPVRSLRFDPSDGEDRPTFALASFSLRPAPQFVHPTALDKAPKVLLNLVRLLPGDRGAGGAGRVCLAIVRELPRHVRLRVAVSPHHAHLATTYPEAEFVIVRGDDRISMAPHLEWCDCYIDPLNALRPKIIAPGKPTIALLHDLQHMRLPHFFSAGERRARAAEYGYAAARADRLIAISNYERENFLRYYGRQAVSVVHNAAFMAEDSGLDEAAVRARRVKTRNAQPYLLYSAVPWPHKNHEILVQAVAILRRRGLDLPVVLTNARGRVGVGQRIENLATAMGVGDLVDRKAYLPESELLALTIGALGVVSPSLYEGFGIPLADAMQLGAPVLAADRAATREVCGDAVAYFSNPQNAIAVADDLASFWRDADLRASLTEAGLQRARMFSSSRAGKALAEAVAATIDAARAGVIERATPARCEPFAPLAVLAIYRDLSPADVDALRRVADLDDFHASIFGADTHVTCAVDIQYLDDPILRELFGGAARVICFDGATPVADTLSVQDFATRFDDANLHLITHYPECAQRYSPAAVSMLVQGISLHPQADYVILDADATDFILHDVPSKVDGVLAFEARRREGPVVFDAMVRRDAIGDAPNGTFAFLSNFCTRARRLSAPENGP